MRFVPARPEQHVVCLLCLPATSRVDTLVLGWPRRARSTEDLQGRCSHHAFILTPSSRGAAHCLSKKRLFFNGRPHVLCLRCRILLRCRVCLKRRGCSRGGADKNQAASFLRVCRAFSGRYNAESDKPLQCAALQRESLSTWCLCCLLSCP